MGFTYPSNKICPKCGTGGYVWYLDNSEYVAKCTNCGHYFRREDFPMCVLDRAKKPITNADHIRSMSDEELAGFIGEVTACGYGMCAPGHYDCTGKNSCAPCWLDWLRQEVEDGET